ncbi:SIS domain-containing protein [uncultured Thiodictyon sp.]|uniref:D-sedoheptulose-7-phosphate isomerase n=1 Tax=uncultured Thiodictyon sp. TaxID=1846217 RepID=UPI0025FA8D25|nr:SIS domain-containing protein [uncultured Thiodictyon sp.]
MFETELREHQSTISLLLDRTSIIESAAAALSDALASGRKILLCGNGGSAADAQHLAAELMVRYERNRPPLAAIALTTDTSLVTAHANDYDFDTLFARQLLGLGHAGDCLIAISTSGQSGNVIRAAATAHDMGLIVIALTGHDGGQLAPLAHFPVIVPSDVTARIQEAHILIGHYWCKQIEATLDATPGGA